MFQFSKISAAVGLFTCFNQASAYSKSKVLAVEHKKLSDALRESYHVESKVWNQNWDNAKNKHGTKKINIFLLTPVAKPKRVLLDEATGDYKKNNNLLDQMEKYTRLIELMTCYFESFEEFKTLSWLHVTDNEETDTFLKDFSSEVPVLSKIQKNFSVKGAKYIKSIYTASKFLQDPNSVYFKKNSCELNPTLEGFAKVFAEHIKRADVDMKADKFHNDTEFTKLFICSREFVVYTIVKALQLPDYVLGHLDPKPGTLTWLTISPDGEVLLKQFGDQTYFGEALQYCWQAF